MWNDPANELNLTVSLWIDISGNEVKPDTVFVPDYDKAEKLYSSGSIVPGKMLFGITMNRGLNAGVYQAL